LKQRILTGLAAGLVFILITVLGGWLFYGLLLLLAIIGYSEFTRINGFAWNHPGSLIGFAGMLYLLVPWDELGLDAPSSLHMLWLAMFLLLAVTVFTKNKTTIDGAALLLLGALYIGYGFHAMYVVRSGEAFGLTTTLMAFGAIWASDAGAYFTGRAIGKHKLWPSISPNKTIEGALGGVVLSAAVAIAFWLSSPGAFGFGQALEIGLVAAVAGQLGDLVQSAYKRVRGIKDTGKLLPGHGGVLDRCDSWLIVFPILLMTGLLPL
jgi:phosphatidate cytidylyltransferase